ncbi:MAG: 30S ribosomal protein S20 [Anaerolineae bacterium]
MANTKSALKEIRKTARRRVRNRLVRASTRTAVKRAVRTIETGKGDSAQEVQTAFSALDKAASKGVIHKNAAARRKARLTKKLKAKTPKA